MYISQPLGNKLFNIFIVYYINKNKILSTCNGCSFWRVCLSAVKSQNAGGANPVSDSLIPVNSLIRFIILSISSSTAFTLIVHWPWPYIFQNKVFVLL